MPIFGIDFLFLIIVAPKTKLNKLAGKDPNEKAKKRIPA